MIRVLAALVAACSFATSARAQAALAPWFDADGFYNRPGAAVESVTTDLATCRAEAVRLRTVRNTRTATGSAMAFNPDGSYNPVISGAATGIASIIFAIQDARYNGSIEQVEFRDCAIALGYRHFRLSERERASFNAQEDHGFAVLIGAEAPAQGRLNTAENERNYYDPQWASPGYENAAVPATPGADAIEQLPEPTAVAIIPAPPETPAVIARLSPGEVATPQPGMAIIVTSARQLAGSMQIPWAGDTFRFRRVTPDGRFADLVRPATSFGLRSHFNPDRRRDATLAGDFDEPRFSTYQIPAGRYVLSDFGPLNACLGTLTFEVTEGDVVYLGDFVLRPQSLPMAPLFNPVANINASFDNSLRDNLRFAVGDTIEAARAALQADDAAKARLSRVQYQNGYRIPCDGRYVGRAFNVSWPSFDAGQARAFNTDLTAAVAAAQ
ncbi:MAG: hypothetical protein JNJ63_13345 [Hyphomonadaceae bacterium]|nr:hypothetical protein [Hyphomonadaceae bacterium]